MWLNVAGIDWLMSKFKAYMILRDRLLTDTSILRDKLDVAVPDFANGESGGRACTPHLGNVAMQWQRCGNAVVSRPCMNSFCIPTNCTLLLLL